MVRGKSLKTSTTVVPDLILPCVNPDEIKRLDEKLQDKVVFVDFVSKIIFFCFKTMKLIITIINISYLINLVVKS